jgi:hypothetical protein
MDDDGNSTGNKDPHDPREIVIRPSNERERTRAAALTLALFWGLALVSLIIPYANLVLTPLLFILGPFAAWKASQRTHSAYTDVRPENTVPFPPFSPDNRGANTGSRPGLRTQSDVARSRTEDKENQPGTKNTRPIQDGARDDRRKIS